MLHFLNISIVIIQFMECTYKIICPVNVSHSFAGFVAVYLKSKDYFTPIQQNCQEKVLLFRWKIVAKISITNLPPPSPRWRISRPCKGNTFRRKRLRLRFLLKAFGYQTHIQVYRILKIFTTLKCVVSHPPFILPALFIAFIYLRRIYHRYVNYSSGFQTSLSSLDSLFALQSPGVFCSPQNI